MEFASNGFHLAARCWHSLKGLFEFHTVRVILLFLLVVSLVWLLCRLFGRIVRESVHMQFGLLVLFRIMIVRRPS
jgi:hypothetical protein